MSSSGNSTKSVRAMYLKMPFDSDARIAASCSSSIAEPELSI